MANTNPIIDSPEHIYYVVSKSSKLPIDIFPIGAVSKGLKGEDLTEMLLMQKNGAIAFSDDGMPIQNAQFMKLALTYAKMLNVPIMNHAEDIFLRNNVVDQKRKRITNALDTTDKKFTAIAIDSLFDANKEKTAPII